MIAQVKDMYSFLYKLATDEYKGPKFLLVKILLYFLSLFYGLIVAMLAFLNGLYKRRLGCKVISVGNITLGGTGKTSLVEYIVRYLKEQGRQVAILSRGYGGGDEPVMLQQKLKGVAVIVNADRARAASEAVKDYAADTVVLDDGFQQWRLHKDLEVVTIDAVNPFGNRHLLPRGILREPLSSLKRADIFVLAKTNLAKDTLELKRFLNGANPRAPVFESIHKPAGLYDFNKPVELLGIESLKEESVALFCGIADPDSFEKLIKNSGIKAGLSFRFPDHYSYSEEDLKRIAEEAKRSNINTLLTTEKDAARLYAQGRPPQAAAGQRILVLRVELEIKGDDKERFHNRLLALQPL
ncbi:MAG: tetraacyldisaccharide 4'-kinase [Candidatus Omnitrophota bacterium]